MVSFENEFNLFENIQNKRILQVPVQGMAYQKICNQQRRKVAIVKCREVPEVRYFKIT